MSDIAKAQDLPDWDKRNQVHKVLSEMLINVSDQVFQNQSFYVDGYRFINCSFENCTLWIWRGTFEFHHCFFHGSTRRWGEDAMKCIQLYTYGYARRLARRRAGGATRSSRRGRFACARAGRLEPSLAPAEQGGPL